MPNKKPVAKLVSSAIVKAFISDDYNFVFNKKTGVFMRWGKTKDDDPDYAQYGPEIADIEISTICHGVNGKPCSFCYKSNGPKGQYMSFETFEKVFAKLPPQLTQIAFGIGDIDSNPDLWKIMQHCRKNGVIPNITINGDRMNTEYYEQLVELCGAVAVSHYTDDICFNAVQMLNMHGLKQINIHQLLCEETYDVCMKLVDDAVRDPRLKGLRAIVFLALKPHGRGDTLTPLRSVDKYRQLIQKAQQNGVGIGFDSCSAPTFLKAMEGDENYQRYEMLAEPCESTLFSVYINTEGKMFPCSFLEDRFEGIDVTQVENFNRDVWHAPSVVDWRKDLLATATCDGCLVHGCRQCPEFDIYGGQNESP